MNIEFQEGSVCWCYRPRSKKIFLPFDLAQSKTVKRAIATFSLEPALLKSSPHMTLANFVGEVSRLRKAGFPEHVLTGVTEALLQKFKGRKRHRGHKVVAMLNQW